MMTLVSCITRVGEVGTGHPGFRTKFNFYMKNKVFLGLNLSDFNCLCTIISYHTS